MQPFNINRFRGGYAVVFNDETGKRRRFALKSKGRSAAMAEAAEIVEAYFQLPPSEVTIKDILDKYCSYLGDRPSGRRLRGCHVLREYFGHFKPNQITDEFVEKYIEGRVNSKTGEPISNETLWTELGGLRDAISYAVKRKIISQNDAPYIQRPPKPQPRDRPLSRDEVRRLLAAAENTPHLYISLLLLLGTAGRVSAVLDLTWDRVDFKRNVVDLRLNSSGPRKGRARVPMNPGLKRALSRWRDQSLSAEDLGNRVITFGGKPVKSIKTAFYNALKAADLQDVRIHDLRHTSAVWMLEAGSSIQRISQYLGHTSLDQTFKVYARYLPDHLREESDALDVSKLLSVWAVAEYLGGESAAEIRDLSLSSTRSKIIDILNSSNSDEYVDYFLRETTRQLIEEVWIGLKELDYQNDK